MRPHDDELLPGCSELPASDLPAAPAALHAAVLAATRPTLRRRRWQRRATAVVALVAVYGLGFVSGRGKPVDLAPQEPAPVVPEALPSAPAVNDPAVLERLAVHSPRRRSEHLRRAGDLYLEGSDLAAAVRCYTRYLALTGAAGVSADDTWLLATLKNSKS